MWSSLRLCWGRHLLIFSFSSDFFHHHNKSTTMVVQRIPRPLQVAVGSISIIALCAVPGMFIVHVWVYHLDLAYTELMWCVSEILAINWCILSLTTVTRLWSYTLVFKSNTKEGHEIFSSEKPEVRPYPTHYHFLFHDFFDVTSWCVLDRCMYLAYPRHTSSSIHTIASQMHH